MQGGGGQNSDKCGFRGLRAKEGNSAGGREADGWGHWVREWMTEFGRE